jgi:hypothetical protein
MAKATSKFKNVTTVMDMPAKPAKKAAKKSVGRRRADTTTRRAVAINVNQLPDGIEALPIEKWTNGHQNFTHKFKKGASFKLIIPHGSTKNGDLYRMTTRNIMSLIQFGIDNQIEMRAIGNGWSFTKVMVCNGGVIDTKALRLGFRPPNEFLHADYLQKGKTTQDIFLAQCGFSVLNINEVLEKQFGRSLKASGASNGQSIAGATSTGTHGSAYNFGAVHDAIIGLHIVVGPNRHVWLERSSNKIASDKLISWLEAERISDDDLFNAALVSFGSFGFIHGIMLETDPIYLLEEHKSSELVYDAKMVKALTKLDFDAIADRLPHPAKTSERELYHFGLIANPHDFAKNDPNKGIFMTTMYKMAYTPNYEKRKPNRKGFEYGDNTLGLIQRILDALPNFLNLLVVPPLINMMVPLAFQPSPAQLGTVGETFAETNIRGQAASAAIGVSAADTAKVWDLICEQNAKTPFPGVVGIRYVKGTKALLGFTKFPTTCIMEMDSADSEVSNKFFRKIWAELENRNIPYTVHWGKINFHLNKKLVRKMYGDAVVDKWLACRKQLLDEETRKVFNNEFLQICGLVG